MRREYSPGIHSPHWPAQVVLGGGVHTFLPEPGPLSPGDT